MQGVRAGDKTSSHAFQFAVQCALEPMLNKWKEDGVPHDLYCYMDDVTATTTDWASVERIIADLTDALGSIGLSINVSKSTVLCPTGVPQYANEIVNVPVVAANHYFRVLGGNVTSVYTYEDGSDFVTEKIKKDNAFFDLLLDLSPDLHPQVVFSMLSLCGSGKLIFLCSTAPPDIAAPIALNFDLRVQQLIKALIGFGPDRDLSSLSKKLITDHAGLAIPNYTTAHSALYRTSKKFAENESKFAKRQFVSLISHERSSTTIDAQQGTWANNWMYFSGGVKTLSHNKYRVALAVRIRANPFNTPLGFPCHCHNFTIETDQDFIEHILKCSKATFGFDKRHDNVKYALEGTARRYGIGFTNEPNYYVYDDKAKRRPDVTFYTHQPTVIDVTIVFPSTLDGTRASKAAKDKIKKHRKAIAKYDHHFVPFVMETFGHFDKCCGTVINRLTRDLPRYEHKEFRRDMIHDAATALADGVATAVIAAHHDFTSATPHS